MKKRYMTQHFKRELTNGEENALEQIGRAISYLTMHGWSIDMAVKPPEEKPTEG